MTYRVTREVKALPQALHQVTVAPLIKFAPFTVTVTGLDVPAVAALGASELTIGALMVKLRAFEETPLEESLTETIAVPGVVRSVARTVAVIDVEEAAEMVSGVV